MELIFGNFLEEGDIILWYCDWLWDYGWVEQWIMDFY